MYLNKKAQSINNTFCQLAYSCADSFLERTAHLSNAKHYRTVDNAETVN